MEVFLVEIAHCPLLTCHHVWMLAAALKKTPLSILHMVGTFVFVVLKTIQITVYMYILILCMFVADPTELLLPETESHTEDCSASVLPVQSTNSLTDTLPQSKCYCTSPPSGRRKIY